MPNFGDPSYWDKRYTEQKNKVFDWLEDYYTLKPLLEKICTKESKILMLGCGNSTLSEDMYLNGYENIYNIDISPIVIEQMGKRNQNLSAMKYEVMDCMDMSFTVETFDVVIDKSTIDALLCSDDSFVNVAKMLKEVQRVLKVGGYYWAISYGAPQSRMEHLTRKHLSFEIEVTSLEPKDPKAGIHYSYICKKKPDADVKCNENWHRVREEIEADELKEKMLKFPQKINLDAKIKIPIFSEDDEEKEEYEYEREEKEDEDDFDLLEMTNGQLEGLLAKIQIENEEIDKWKPPVVEKEGAKSERTHTARNSVGASLQDLEKPNGSALNSQRESETHQTLEKSDAQEKTEQPVSNKSIDAPEKKNPNSTDKESDSKDPSKIEKEKTVSNNSKPTTSKVPVVNTKKQ